MIGSVECCSRAVCFKMFLLVSPVFYCNLQWDYSDLWSFFLPNLLLSPTSSPLSSWTSRPKVYTSSRRSLNVTTHSWMVVCTSKIFFFFFYYKWIISCINIQDSHIFINLAVTDKLTVTLKLTWPSVMWHTAIFQIRFLSKILISCSLANIFN